MRERHLLLDLMYLLSFLYYIYLTEVTGRCSGRKLKEALCTVQLHLAMTVKEP